MVGLSFSVNMGRLKDGDVKLVATAQKMTFTVSVKPN